MEVCATTHQTHQTRSTPRESSSAGALGVTPRSLPLIAPLPGASVSLMPVPVSATPSLQLVIGSARGSTTIGRMEPRLPVAAASVETLVASPDLAPFAPAAAAVTASTSAVSTVSSVGTRSSTSVRFAPSAQLTPVAAGPASSLALGLTAFHRVPVSAAPSAVDSAAAELGGAWRPSLSLAPPSAASSLTGQMQLATGIPLSLCPPTAATSASSVSSIGCAAGPPASNNTAGGGRRESLGLLGMSLGRAGHASILSPSLMAPPQAAQLSTADAGFGLGAGVGASAAAAVANAAAAAAAAFASSTALGVSSRLRPEVPDSAAAGGADPTGRTAALRRGGSLGSAFGGPLGGSLGGALGSPLGSALTGSPLGQTVAGVALTAITEAAATAAAAVNAAAAAGVGAGHDGDAHDGESDHLYVYGHGYGYGHGQGRHHGHTHNPGLGALLPSP